MSKRFFASAFAMIGFAAVFGGSASAVSGETATISDGNWDVCIASTASYAGSNFAVSISGQGFETQLAYGDFTTETCKTVALATGGDNTVAVKKPMGVGDVSYEIDTVNNKLVFSYGSLIEKYLKIYSSTESVIDASQVRIVFDANGGEGTMNNQGGIDLNTNTTFTSNAFTKHGFSFDSWNTEADGSGTRYEDGDTVNFATGGEVTLYAQWQIRVTALKTGQNINSALKTLAKGSVASYTDTDTAIKNLEFVDALPNTIDANTPSTNLALDNEIPVYAYWVASEEKIYIYTEAGKMNANTDSSYIFGYLQALTSLVLPAGFDTSNAVNMSYMFRDMPALTLLTLPESFTASSATSTRAMFYNMQTLTSLRIPTNFNPSHVTDMSSMFNNMWALTTLTLPNSFDTSSAEDMSYMFVSTQSLTSLTLPDDFDTSNVRDMRYMFAYSRTLTSLTLPANFKTSNVTDMDSMFRNMYELTSLTLPAGFDTSNVTKMTYMFSGLTSISSLTLPDSFVIASGVATTDIFANIPTTATLNATDATAQSLWQSR